MSRQKGVSYVDFLGCCGFSILGTVLLFDEMLFLKLAFCLIVCPVVVWTIVSHSREIFQALLWLARHGWPHLRRWGRATWRWFQSAWNGVSRRNAV